MSSGKGHSETVKSLNRSYAPEEKPFASTKPAKLKKRLAYLSGVYFIGSLLENSLAFFFIPIYTAYLGTYDYGVIGLMSVAVGLVSKLVGPPVISGFSRHYHAPEYRARKGLVLFNSFVFLAAAAFILAFSFYYLRNMICSVILDNPDLVHIVETYALILFFMPLSEFMLTFLRQEEKAKLFIGVSWGRFLISAGVILFGLVKLKMGVLALIYGNLFGLIFTVVCVFPVFWKFSTRRLLFRVLAPLLKFGYPLILQGFAILLIESGDRYVLRFFSSVGVVGLYSFGYKFAAVINIVLVVPFKYALQPLVLKQEETPEKLKNFVRNICTFFYLGGMFLCLGLALFSKEAMQIMARTAEFREAWIIVPIVAFSYLQHGMGNFFNWGVTMAKKPYHVSAIVLVTAAVNIGLNFVFIPFWGILGAAFATLISYIIWNGIKIHYAIKFYGLRFDMARIVHVSVVGVGLYALSLVVANSHSVLLNVTIKGVLVAIYFPMFFLSYFFTKEEKDYFRKMLGRVRADGLKHAFVKGEGK